MMLLSIKGEILNFQILPTYLHANTTRPADAVHHFGFFVSTEFLGRRCRIHVPAVTLTHLRSLRYQDCTKVTSLLQANLSALRDVEVTCETQDSISEFELVNFEGCAKSG
jgi:hypothetical protein